MVFNLRQLTARHGLRYAWAYSAVKRGCGPPLIQDGRCSLLRIDEAAFLRWLALQPPRIERRPAPRDAFERAMRDLEYRTR